MASAPATAKQTETSTSESEQKENYPLKASVKAGVQIFKKGRLIWDAEKEPTLDVDVVANRLIHD